VKFAVVGDPVDHSRSPAIHNAGFSELGVDAVYHHLLVAHNAFDTVVSQLRDGQLNGVNVTMPHKKNAYAAVDIRTDRALATGAVNTITVDDGQLVGDNTDVAGVRYSLAKPHMATSAPVLILGAGGAAAAAVVATTDRVQYGSARTLAAVESVAARIDSELHTVAWGEGVAGAILINATPLGMHGEDLPTGIIESSSGFVDMTYGSDRSPAMGRAFNASIPAVDGTEMLLGQALEAFTRFTGHPAPERAMRAALAG